MRGKIKSLIVLDIGNTKFNVAFYVNDHNNDDDDDAVTNPQVGVDSKKKNTPQQRYQLLYQLLTGVTCVYGLLWQRRQASLTVLRCSGGSPLSSAKQIACIL